MRRITNLLTLVCLIICIANAYSQQFITPEQAMNAVRIFEGKPDLEFKDVELCHDTSGPSWSHRSWYSLKHKDYPTVAIDWMVDARTGEVVSAYYGDACPDAPSDPFGPLTKEQCRQIAEQFARSKYAGFDEMNLQLVAEEWTGKGWRFEWRERLAFGIEGINGVAVSVNPATGRIQSYSADRLLGEVHPPRQPKLTKEEAIERAKEVTGIVTVDWVEEPILTADPMGGVYWSLAIGGRDSEGEYRGYAITMSAEDGEIVGIAYQKARGKPIIPAHLQPVRGGWRGWVFIGLGLGLVTLVITIWLSLRWYQRASWRR